MANMREQLYMIENISGYATMIKMYKMFKCYESQLNLIISYHFLKYMNPKHYKFYIITSSTPNRSIGNLQYML